MMGVEMDDGGWVSGSKSVRISTNNFTLQEVQLLSQMFKTKFDLDCTPLRCKILRFAWILHFFFIFSFTKLKSKTKKKNDGGIIYIYIYNVFSDFAPKGRWQYTGQVFNLYQSCLFTFIFFLFLFFFYVHKVRKKAKKMTFLTQWRGQAKKKIR